jgi:hypothetical protein
VDVEPSFSIAENHGCSDLGMDVVGEGVLHNFTLEQSQLKDGDKPWRGGREKDPFFLQILIESFSKPGDVVLDCNASTGMCPSSMHLILELILRSK